MTTPLDAIVANTDSPNSHNMISHISHGLYLGSLETLSHPTILRSHGITHILSLTSSSLPPQPADFVHKHFKVLDTRHQNLLFYLLAAINFLEDAFTGVVPARDALRPPKVYVHCRMGISRSASVVIGYLMKQHNLTYAAATEAVRSRRSIVNPNRGFQSQLQFLASVGWREDLVAPELLTQGLANPWDPEERRRPRRERWEKEGPAVWAVLNVHGENRAVLKACLQELVDRGLMKGRTTAQKEERRSRKKREEQERIAALLGEIEKKVVGEVGEVSALDGGLERFNRLVMERAARIREDVEPAETPTPDDNKPDDTPMADS